MNPGGRPHPPPAEPTLVMRDEPLRAQSSIHSIMFVIRVTLLCAAFGLAGCVPSTVGVAKPGPGLSQKAVATLKTYRLWVVRTSWHTGLALSPAEAGPALTSLVPPTSRIRYLVFGWGARRFYLSHHPTSGMALAALFPSRSVMLVEPCRRKLELCLGSATHLDAVRITRTGLLRLRIYLRHSFTKGPGGETVPLRSGPTFHSEFFASGLDYDAFHTCNTWTAQALAAAGLPVTSAGVMFAYQVWSQLPRASAG